MLSLAILLLILQGVPVPAFQSGSITGVLTTSAGKPAIGVRVSALARLDSADALAASSMAGIAETDQNGVYKLENVPPGRYYIIAGRVDLPTYYPGTLEMAFGKDVLVTPGAALNGLNFALKDNSVGRAYHGTSYLVLAWTVPIQVKVEGGKKVPLFDAGLSPVVRLTHARDNQRLEAPFSATSLSVPLAANGEFRVTVENLSKRYAVKSIVSDKTNLLVDTLKLPVPTVPLPLPAVPGPTISNTTAGVWATSLSFSAVGSMSPIPSVPTVEITLTEAATAARTGAILSGTLPAPFERSIEASGIPGSIYDDGTFEVKNVPAGRHILLTRNNPVGTRPVGVSIVVGDQDIPNIQVQQILEIPRDLDAGAVAVGTQNPGTVVPLANVSGQLVDESTGATFDLPRSIGRITINGNTVAYTVNNTGEFDIPSLLPGRYDVELWIVGGKTYSRTLEVRDDNMTFQWPVSVPE